MRILPCVLVGVLWAPPLEGQGPPALDTAALSEYVASVARVGQLPDVAVVVVGPEGPLYEGRFTPRGPSTEGVAASPDRFYLGSVSETLTAFAVMRLVDDELIDLDAPVVRYLPRLAFKDAARTGRLTIRHLLAHRSGLPRIGFYNRRVQVQGRLDHIDFVREPGAKHEAASLDYLVLGRVLEAVSGQPSSEHMAERVFEPIGMRSVSADSETARNEGVVTGHRYMFGWPMATDGHAYADAVVPAARVAASAADLGRFLSVLLAHGTRDDAPSLSVSGVEALLPTAVNQATGTDPALAYGWEPLWGEDVRARYQEGLSPGFHALIAVLPEQGLGIVVLASRAGGPGPDAASVLLRGVADRALGRAGQAYFLWERILHLMLLILVVVGIILLPLRWLHRWRASGRPTAIAHTPPILSRLALELAFAAALPLLIILGVEKMSIMALLRLHPDLAIAVIAFPFAAIPTAVWKTLVRSEDWRRSQKAVPPTS